MAANVVKQRAMLSIGATGVPELATFIQTAFKASIGRAQALADTSMTIFLRNIHDTGYRQIEAAGTDLKYRYIGPDDKLTRRFCRLLIRLTEAGTTWSRAQIGEMDNHELPDVFSTGGGYNCRHWFVVAKINGRLVGAPPRSTPEAVAA